MLVFWNLACVWQVFLNNFFGNLHFLLKCNIVLFTFYFQDIFKQATEDRLTSAKELPYFEGDFWPNVLEESIKELEQEEEERKREENTVLDESVEVIIYSLILG